MILAIETSCDETSAAVANLDGTVESSGRLRGTWTAVVRRVALDRGRVDGALALGPLAADRAQAGDDAHSGHDEVDDAIVHGYRSEKAAT